MGDNVIGYARYLDLSALSADEDAPRVSQMLASFAPGLSVQSDWEGEIISGKPTDQLAGMRTFSAYWTADLEACVHVQAAALLDDASSISHELKQLVLPRLPAWTVEVEALTP